MSTEPHDEVEGGPEPAPHPEDRPEAQESGKRAQPQKPRGAQRESADKHDPPPWYQPESGQPGTS